MVRLLGQPMLLPLAQSSPFDGDRPSERSRQLAYRRNPKFCIGPLPITQDTIDADVQSKGNRLGSTTVYDVIAGCPLSLRKLCERRGPHPGLLDTTTARLLLALRSLGIAVLEDRRRQRRANKGEIVDFCVGEGAAWFQFVEATVDQAVLEPCARGYLVCHSRSEKEGFCQPSRHRVDGARCLLIVGIGMECGARYVDRRLSASGLSGQRKATAGSGVRTAASSSTSAASVCSTVRSIRAMSPHSWCSGCCV